MGASDSHDERFVVLRDGCVVPAPALLLLLDLERRGFTVTREGRTTLVVRPPEQLTAADCDEIRRWKVQLLLLLDYCARPGLDAHLFADDAPDRRAS